MAKPKTNKELSIRDLNKIFSPHIKDVSGSTQKDAFKMWAALNNTAKDYEKRFEVISKRITEANDSLSGQLNIYKSLYKHAKKYTKLDEEYLSQIKNRIALLEKEVKISDKRSASQRILNSLQYEGNKILKETIKNNAEIFRISHEMQLESNVTWTNYRKLYSGAYEATRKANREVEQSIHNVKDLVQTQNRLLGTGWRNIDTGTLTNVSSSVMTLQKTLGKLDTNLVNGLQQSYRLFGDQTNTFVNNLGNRLNSFSNTFGVTVDMLQTAVSDMIESNNFIHRSNLQAQTAANESLIKAATLAGSIGLMSSTFITKLAETAQFGTMEEMATIYQGGALLQGFDTQRFQQQMIDTDYEGATKQLLESIHGTLNNIDDHYLRAEYMSQIGSSFGLSRDELKVIATSGDKLGEYSAEMQEKLFGVNTSMKDELTDLRVNLVDRVTSAVQNWWGSEKLGSVMQEMGLYGLEGYMGSILRWVRIIGSKSLMGDSGVGGMLGKMPALTKQVGQVPTGMLASGTIPGSTMTGLNTAGTPYAPTTVLTGAGKVVTGLGGLSIAGIGNYAGSQIQQNTNMSTPAANIVGGGVNLATGIGGGAMAGSIFGPVGAAIGAGIGAIVGGINTWKSADKRKDALQEIEDEERRARAANAASTFVDYGDPVVNAINAQTKALVQIISGNHEENKTFVLLGDTYRKTTTIPEV